MKTVNEKYLILAVVNNGEGDYQFHIISESEYNQEGFYFSNYAGSHGNAYIETEKDSNKFLRFDSAEKAQDYALKLKSEFDKKMQPYLNYYAEMRTYC